MLLGEKRLRTLAEAVLRRCGDWPAEVMLGAGDEALTRFANNTIHQNVAERNVSVSLRVFRGHRAGGATTNRLDDQGLDDLVARAKANAEVSPEDPEFLDLTPPQTYPQVEAFDEATAAYTPQARAEAVGLVCRLAQERGFTAAGAFSTAVHELALANSAGLWAYFPSTTANFLTTVMADEVASGRAEAVAWRVSGLPPIEDLAREAVRKADLARNPRPLDPGEYPVVLDPYATGDLLQMLNFYGMGAQAVQEGRSWMAHRLGQQAMSPLVSIWDDALDSRTLPRPFDFEGMPKRRVDIVKEGVVLGPVYDRRTARKEGKESTGHGLPPGARGFGPVAFNLFLAPGDLSTADLLRRMGRGLYITRFWYTRLVHPRDCVVTGMTRDGVYWVEDGEIAYPVKNLRFTQSYVDALAGVEAVGRETRLLGGEFGGTATFVPALYLRAFRFTGATV